MTYCNDAYKKDLKYYDTSEWDTSEIDTKIMQTYPDKSLKVNLEGLFNGMNSCPRPNTDALFGVEAEQEQIDSAAERKRTPVFSGFVNYFPDAMKAVAKLSLIANEQHNPGQPLHWAKGKSTDHSDCLMRHMLDHISDTPVDEDGVSHLTKVAWRAMAWLQTELEKEAK